MPVVSTAAGVGQVEQNQHPPNHWEGKGQVNARAHQGQEEHRQQLRIDALADVFPGHAHLLHDFEALLVLIALGNLLVIDDQYRGKEEHDAQQNAQEEESAVGAVEIIAVLGYALQINIFHAQAVKAIRQFHIHLIRHLRH